MFLGAGDNVFLSWSLLVFLAEHTIIPVEGAICTATMMNDFCPFLMIFVCTDSLLILSICLI